MSLLLLLDGDSAEPVTSTASWAQAAGTWSATASERIAATASWSQAPGGQAVYYDGEVVTDGDEVVTFDDEGGWLALTWQEMVAAATFAQLATWAAEAQAVSPVSAEGTWEQTASWAAVLVERFAATGTFEQTASWEADASESIPSAAEWSQDASWGAVAQSAEDVTAEAAWAQSAAWQATTQQLIPSVATWEQPATWEAAVEADEPSDTIDAVGEWTQAATWSAVTSQLTAPAVRRSSSRRRPVPRHEPVLIPSTASFGQAPATWAASLAVMQPDLEVLVLAGVL